MSLTLVTGGTRSGKSRHAERLAAAGGRPVRYVATADPVDPSMAERIREHAARRPPEWSVVEAGDGLAAAVRGAEPGSCVLIDGLGPWIATALHRAGAFDGEIDERTLSGLHEELLAEVVGIADAAREGAEVIVVAEEAGQGVLPAERSSRAWLDLLGDAVQSLAAAASRVELVIAGRALSLDGGPAGSSGPGRPDRDPEHDLRHHGDRELRPGDADHAVNVVAGGPPDWLREALRRALEEDAGGYPDEAEAIAAIAALHGREPDEVVPTNGAAEALWLLPAALRPELAACVHPAFTEAEAALRTHGVAVTRVLRDPERDFALDPTKVPSAADLVVAGNPASPSGTLDPATAILALRQPGRVVTVDEAFMDLVPGEPATLARERAGDLIVVRSLTKALAIPGLRVGYALAAPALAERLRAVRPPWSANALALAALAAAATRPDAFAALAERTQSERQDLAGRLAALPGVRSWPAAANFCLVEVADGPVAVAALRDRGIAVRHAASFPGLGPGHLRITARGPEENERLARALAEALA
jgi:histidinol-phosphate/aromatic aminotransferase/cobyric acid decarboxylase-like protein/adenosyl cobinamide kinase/adenosyl cobinamide phosphate guanylyltransferase